MKTLITALSLVVVTVALSRAGVVSTGGGTIVTTEVPAQSCGWDAGDITLGIYAAGVLPDGDPHLDDGIGGGVSLGYTFCEWFSVEADATWVENDSTIHAFTGSAIIRCPVEGLCIAPYVIGGGGVSTNSETQGIVHLGGGLEWKCKSTGHSLFAEGRYVWADETENYTLVRGGIKFEF